MTIPPPNAASKTTFLTISKTNTLTFWTKDYLFNYHNLDKENYITINKRRERVLKELALELSSLLGISKELVFLTRNNEFDKRLKEVKLNISVKVKD